MPSYAYIVSNPSQAQILRLLRPLSELPIGRAHLSLVARYIGFGRLYTKCYLSLLVVVARLAATLLTTAFTNLFTTTNVITQTFINGTEILRRWISGFGSVSRYFWRTAHSHHSTTTASKKRCTMVALNYGRWTNPTSVLSIT
jgi:hypothetical protein